MLLKVNTVTIEFTPPPWQMVAQGSLSISESSRGCEKCQCTLGQDVFPIGGGGECMCESSLPQLRVERMSCYFSRWAGISELCLGSCGSNVACTSDSKHFNNS